MLVLAAVACAAPGEEESIDAVELGRGKRGFEPLTDGDAVDTVIGPQGAEMIVFRLRAIGPTAPPTSLVADIDIAGETTDGAIHAELTVDDAYVSEEVEILLAPRPGELLTVTASAGDATVVRVLQVARSATRQ